MSGHALLSPSGASRWLACPPSARLELQFPDKRSTASEEGTLAHELAELLIKEKTGRIKAYEYNQALVKIQAHKLYESAMLDYIDEYASYIVERYARAQADTADAQLFLEQKLQLSDYVPESFGTSDVVIIANGVMAIIDLKYGKGVPVSAVNNKQMMLYALGALCEFDFLYEIHTVRMTIYQPRLDSITDWEISVEELRQWAEVELKPLATMAFKGEGDHTPGAHCRFCKAAAICKANADANLELTKYEFKPGALLLDTDISDILDRADNFTSWLKAVTDYALDQAVQHGKRWPGYKLVEGRSNRQYSNEEEVVAKLKAHEFSDDSIYNKKLLGITDMEKLLGKKFFPIYLEGLVIKPPGKPTLAPITDKRPEINSVESANIDFQ